MPEQPSSVIKSDLKEDFCTNSCPDCSCRLSGNNEKPKVARGDASVRNHPEVLIAFLRNALPQSSHGHAKTLKILENLVVMGMAASYKFVSRGILSAT